VRQMRQITAQTVLQELEAHFGLGDATNVETLRIEWPSGHVTEVHNVAANQILPIQEPPGVKCLGSDGTNMRLAITGNIGEQYQLLTSADVALSLDNWECWGTNLQTSRTMLVTNSSPLASQRFHTALPAK
jgi:ASPIC/UnbV protein